MKKRIIPITIAFILVIASPIMAMAHSGGTDSAGGHHDYNNVSGLGSYHYHHGYGPHLHTNGVCPYSSSYSTSSTSSGSSSKSYNSGYNAGYENGQYDGFESGKESGYNEGYDDGYDEGYYDGEKSKSGSVAAAAVISGASGIGIGAAIHAIYKRRFEQAEAEAAKEAKK